VRVWRADTGQDAFSRPLRSAQDPNCLAAVSADGGLLAAVAPDGAVVLWGLADGGERCRLECRGARSLAFSPDGKILAVGGDEPVTLYDTAGGRKLRTLAEGTRSVAGQMAFSADGRFLVMLAAAREGLELRGCADDANGFRKFAPAIGRPAAFAWAPQGSVLAVAGDQGVMLEEVVEGGRAILRTETAVTAVAFHPDGRTLVTGDPDGVLRWWDVSNLWAGVRPLAQRRWQAGPIVRLCFAPGGATLAVATLDGRVYPVPASVSPAEPLRPAFAARGPLAFAPDGRALAVADPAGKVWLLDLPGGTVRLELAGRLLGGRVLAPPDGRGGAVRVELPDLPGPVDALAFSADGRLAALGRGDDSVTVWDLPGPRPRRLLAAPRAGLHCLAFSADGARLAAAGGDRLVHFWDAASGQRCGELAGHVELVRALAFSPNGRDLVAACVGGELLLWDVAGAALPRQPWATLEVPREAAEVVFSPDGRLLAALALTGGVRLWRLDGRQPPALLGDLPGAPLGMDRDGAVPGRQLAFSPDGQTLWVLGRWALTGWDVPGRRARLHFGGSWSGLAVAPGDGRLALATSDGVVRLWAPEGPEVDQPPGQPCGPVQALAFSPDGGILYTSSGEPVWTVTRCSRPDPLLSPLVGALGLKTGDILRQDLLLFSLEGGLRCWDAASGQALPGLPRAASACRRRCWPWPRTAV
jgi:WD40 repeat protein